MPPHPTAGSVKLVTEAKKKKLNISCSVSIHNLFFTDVVLEGFDSRYKVMPPLRTKADAKALLKGLHDGVIDFVTADHIPMNIEQKQVEFDHRGPSACSRPPDLRGFATPRRRADRTRASRASRPPQPADLPDPLPIFPMART